MGNTYLVTGSAGFIGAKIAELLLSRGDTVVGLDNMNDYYSVSLKQYRVEQLQQYDDFSFYKVDIEDRSKLEALFSKYSFTGILHLAARAGVGCSIKDPEVYYSTNVHGTLHLLELMRTGNIKKMVLASTSSLYAGQPMPFCEDLPANTPISPYAASKKGAETLAYTYHYLYDLDITILRYFTVFGPAGRPDMSLFRFIEWIKRGEPVQLFGDGSQSRDFTYVDDVAEATVAALIPMGYEIVNIGGGRNPKSLNTMIAHIEAVLGKKAIVVQQASEKTDITTTWADITKARKLLSWRPKVFVEKGIERTVAWHRSFNKQELLS